MLRRTFISSLAAAAMLSLASVAPAMAADLVVFAAASMKGSLDDVAKAFEARNGTKVVISYASSSQLAKQIEAAAPADVFISADTKWMDYLVEKAAGEEGSRRQSARQPSGARRRQGFQLPIKIEKGFTLAEALGDSRLAMGDPKSRAGRQIRPGIAEVLWRLGRRRGKVAGADNVRAALKLVSSAKRRSASSTRPTPRPTRTSRSSISSAKTAIRRSFIPSRRSRHRPMKRRTRS